MIDRLSIVTIAVKDQEEALKFYTEKLGFEKRADETFGPGARWLTVAPKGQTDVEILLQKPEPALQGKEGAEKLAGLIGKNPTWSFSTKDCFKAYETLLANGVNFLSPPSDVPYGTEAIFEDLYGNTFSLLQPAD